MTRLQRLSPVLLGALMAACSEAQPYVQPVAPVAAQAVVVDAGLGDRTARLDLRAAAAYALQATSTVHRWVPSDLVRYDVELRVRNATTATQYDAVGQGLTAQVPVNGQGAGSATFTKLRPGAYYRAYVKAMGKAGGASAQGTEVAMNAQAQNDHVDFDFTAVNDLAQEVSRMVTVNFDGVAFSGTGALSFGSPSPGPYLGPSEAPTVAVSHPPSAARALQQLVASYTVGNSPAGVAVDAQGNAWVANNTSSSTTVTKLASNGSPLGTFGVGNAPLDVAIDAQGNAWVACEGNPHVSPEISPSLVKLASNGAPLGTFSLGTKPSALTIDGQGNVWLANGGNKDVTKLASSGSHLGTFSAYLSPADVAIDAQGNVWLSSSSSVLNHVTKLASNGSLLGTFTAAGGAKGLDIDHQGQVWVASSNANAVFKLASTGSLLASFAVAGGPYAVAVDGEGRAWVSTLSGPLTVLSSQGAVLATHALGWVRGIAVSSDGQVWATRFSDNSVALFS